MKTSLYVPVHMIIIPWKCCILNPNKNDLMTSTKQFNFSCVLSVGGFSFISNDLATFLQNV